MFARHTPTRMKGSAVVQGLKSLASKLHPQLPLSPRESQRLLTALTSSFRQRLDEAHPPRQAGGGDARPKPEPAAALKAGAQSLHSSSAGLADKHLASVLTNPLLVKHDGKGQPKLDYASAKIELVKNPAKEPISLLEEYHKKGAATIPIAVLCLETFNRSIDNLPKAKRQSTILEVQAGKRTLLWLWDNKLHKTSAFVDDVRLMDVLVLFVIQEGLEKYLWDWWKIDMVLGEQKSLSLSNTRLIGLRERYRWKGRLIHAIVAAKMDEAQDMCANSALDAFFEACELKKAARSQGIPEFTMPLGQAAVLLTRAFVRPPRRWTVDPDRYSRFIECTKFHQSPGITTEWRQSVLHLHHPRLPSPLPALNVLKAAFDAHPSPDALVLRPYFENPRGERELVYFYSLMVRTAAQLQGSVRTQDAQWVISQIRRLYPERARDYLDKDLDRGLREFKRAITTSPTIDDEGSYSVHEPIPFPSFA